MKSEKKELFRESGKLLRQVIRLIGLLCVLALLIRAIIDMV